MGAWDVFVGLLGPVMVGLLLIVLGWAASERGRVHHYLAHRRRASDVHATSGTGRVSFIGRSPRRRT